MAVTLKSIVSKEGYNSSDTEYSSTSYPTSDSDENAPQRVKSRYNSLYKKAPYTQYAYPSILKRSKLVVILPAPVEPVPVHRPSVAATKKRVTPTASSPSSSSLFSSLAKVATKRARTYKSSSSSRPPLSDKEGEEEKRLSHYFQANNPPSNKTRTTYAATERCPVFDRFIKEVIIFSDSPEFKPTQGTLSSDIGRALCKWGKSNPDVTVILNGRAYTTTTVPSIPSYFEKILGFDKPPNHRTSYMVNIRPEFLT